MKPNTIIIPLAVFFFCVTAGVAFAADGDGLFAAAGGFAAGGGLLGLGGSIIGGVSKYFNTRQEIAREKQNNEHEVILQKMQADLQREEGEREMAIAMEAGRAATMTAAITADAQATADASQWVVDVKALFRPALTILLFAMGFWLINLLLKGDLNGVLDPATGAVIIRYSIESVIFTGSAAGMWWFGDRSMAPPSRK